jgi:hypothetical protein
MRRDLLTMTGAYFSLALLMGVLGQSQQEFCAHSDCRMD